MKLNRILTILIAEKSISINTENFLKFPVFFVISSTSLLNI